jgi:hypothetical protein
VREELRRMIDRIVVSPRLDGKPTLTIEIDVFGVMRAAGLLDDGAPDKRKPPREVRRGLRIDLVAGTGFEPVTFRL